MPNPQRKRKAAWFVEIDPALKAEFKRRFPGRSAMTKLTVWAIRQALAAKGYDMSGPPVNRTITVMVADDPISGSHNPISGHDPPPHTDPLPPDETPA